METKGTDGRISTHCWFDNPSSYDSYSLLLGPTSRASIQTRLVTPFNQFVRGLLARQVIIVFSLIFQHEHLESWKELTLIFPERLRVYQL